MRTIQKFIVVYLFFSCVYGCFSVGDYFLAAKDYPQYWWIGIVFLILFLGIGISGYLLLRNKQYSWLTIALQIIQLIGFSIKGYKYQFAAGMALKIGYGANDVLFNFRPIIAEFIVGVNIKDEFIYLNVIPIVILIMITESFERTSSHTNEVEI